MSRYYFKHFATAIAALSAAATLVTALFNCDWVTGVWYYGLIGAAVVLGGSFAYACWQTRSKRKISLDLSSELKLSISEGDLFQQKGIICIPFNEYFDTHVGDGVVGEKTLHGIFINRFFKDRIPELEYKIRSKLPQEGYQVHQRRLEECPDKQYELGTCIDLREGETTYVLFALTHFDDNDKAYSHIRSLGNDRNGYIHAKNSAAKSKNISLHNIEVWINAIKALCLKL